MPPVPRHHRHPLTSQRMPRVGDFYFCWKPAGVVPQCVTDFKQIFSVGQARNRTARAVERAIPFQLACQAITVTWYATAGHDPADVQDHRARAPWYHSRARPSTADMTAKLRQVLIAARFPVSHPDQPTRQEISVIRLAWGDLAA
ncbi:MAG TPA: hypothetical protein VGS06_06385 [Streptosporangiaceae bacterium]|nr:hypothetical protein [Streptosporangiaceae bacterium]